MNLHGPTSPGMEPMSLGSPPQSQGLHQSFSHPAGHASGFLPGYLMGEPGHSVSPSSSRMWSASRSPSKGLTPSSLGPKDSTSRLDRSESFISQRGGINTSTKDHGNAPPVAGLYDHVESPHNLRLTPHHISTPERRQLGSPSMNSLSTSLSRQVNESATTPRQLHSQTSVGLSGLSRSFSQTPQSRPLSLMSPPAMSSPAQIDPFYTQGEAIIPDTELDQTWVTVFGFPPAAASYILQQFSQYGNIQKHVVASNGNWMHLQFSSKLQAKKALSKNGKIFGGNIMIGASRCIDKGVMEGGKENLYSTNLAETPTNKSMVSFHEDIDYTKRKTPIRPLTAAYQAASSSHEVVPDHNTPQKSTSVISKTLEYMLGW